MQDLDISAPQRRTQAERRTETRAALLAAARELFVSQGFAETGTPQLVAKAGVTRGALYHHFTDKTDVFRSLANEEAQAVGALIDEATDNIDDPQDAMVAGTYAFFDAMAVPGRAKLLLLDAPSILGHSEALALIDPAASNSLKEGLRLAIPNASAEYLDALTNVISAAFDRAAMEIVEGAAREPYLEAMFTLIDSAMAKSQHRI